MDHIKFLLQSFVLVLDSSLIVLLKIVNCRFNWYCHGSSLIWPLFKQITRILTNAVTDVSAVHFYLLEYPPTGI